MIHVGDCREVLSAMPPGFADVCIADPPYGDTALVWDKHCKGWIGHVARALKPNASIWCFGSLRFIGPLLAEFERHGFGYSQDIVWEKQNGTGFHNDRFRRVHEHVVLLYRGQWRDVYHLPQFTMDAKAKRVTRSAQPAHTGKIGVSEYTTEAGGPRLARSVLRVRNEHRRAIHPTQKPIDLLLPLIRYSCPPGGMVLDPFSGSASTGVAAARAGMQSLLIERDAAMAALATARLNEPEVVS